MVTESDPNKELFAKYPTTKIKVIQKIDALSHHKTHPINIMFADYNEFVKQVFLRHRDDRGFASVPLIQRLAKKLGLILTKNQVAPATLKVRENANALKERVVQFFCKTIARENTYDSSDLYGADIFNYVINKATSEQIQKGEQII